MLLCLQGTCVLKLHFAAEEDMSKIRGNWTNAGNTQVLGEVSSQLGPNHVRIQRVWMFIVLSMNMNTSKGCRILKQFAAVLGFCTDNTTL